MKSISIIVKQASQLQTSLATLLLSLYNNCSYHYTKMPKRDKKCPGCKYITSTHHWGIPGRFCEGPPAEEDDSHAGSSSSSSAMADTLHTDQHAELLFEKERLLKELEITELAKEVGALKIKLQQHRSEVPPSSAELVNTPMAPMASQQPRLQPAPSAMNHLATASAMLEATPQAAAGYSQSSQHLPRMDADPTRYLQVTAHGSGQPALRIVDFIDTATASTNSHEQHKTSATRKLDTVTMAEWGAANIRLFYELCRGHISHNGGLNEYMAYTVKVWEYAKFFDWRSVLHYNDEYRSLQARYNFPWGTDSQHLATLHFTPRHKSTQEFNSRHKTQVGGNYKGGNNDGYGKFGNTPPICQKFNTQRGCDLTHCNYQHICSIPSCKGRHPSYVHGGDQSSPQPPNPAPAPYPFRG
jgi:hypothetical protein